MTSSNGNIFRVSGLSWVESTGHLWIPLTKDSDAELWCFSMISAWTNGWAHCDVTVMLRWWIIKPAIIWTKQGELLLLIFIPRILIILVHYGSVPGLYHVVSKHYSSAQSTHDDGSKWKYFPRNWSFVRGNHRSPLNSPHKGQWRVAWCFLWSAPE